MFGGDVTSEQSPNLMQTPQLKAGLHRTGHVGLLVKIHAEVAD